MTGAMVAIILITIVIVVGGIALFITGIISAARTQDAELRVGRLLLHLFIWGGPIAAIIYAVNAKK